MALKWLYFFEVKSQYDMQIGSKTATFYGEKYAFDWLKNDKSDYERDENRTEILWKNIS